jgi:hypothetical protein
MFRFCWSSRWTRFVVLFATLCASASLGCGSRKATVSGTISYKGEKLGNGSVKFVGANNQAAVGLIGPDGTYTATSVPLGTVKVSVETVPTGKVSSDTSMGVKGPDMGAQFQGQAGKYVRIPDKYKDAEKSGLTYEVKPGPQTHDINLSD